MSAIHQKLAQIAGEIGPINKDEVNKDQSFRYRSIEAITEKARALFAKAGISTAPTLISVEHSEVTSQKGNRGFRCIAVMGYTFTAAEDDSSIEVSMAGEAIDYGDKATSKAVQMAFKYALTQALLIGSGESDGDAHTLDAMAPPEVRPVHIAKARLLAALEGDKEKARELWTTAAATFGYEPDAVPDDQSQAVLTAALAQVAK